MSEIFISYRRNDSLGYTGRLANDLRKLFGEKHVFRDYESLGIGLPFKQEILDAIRSSSAVLVLIGPTWLEIDNDTGKPRLGNANDLVRLEIEYALQCGIALIPVLVGGAQMPESAIFPEKMQELASFNAHALSEKHWDDDVLLLAKRLEQITGLDIVRQGTTPPPRTPFIQPIVDVIPDFLNLIIKPKIFLRKRGHGRKKDILGAFAFFSLIILISQVYQYNAWSSDIEMSLWDSVITGILVWLLITLLLSIPMWFAWWLAGARNHYLRTTVVLLYQMSITIILATTGASIVMMGAVYRHADKVKQAYQVLKNPEITDKALLLNELLATSWDGDPAKIALIIGLGVIAIVPVWLLLSWTAFREILHQPLWAVWLALLIFIFALNLPFLILTVL